MVILLGDAANVLKDFEDESIDCVVTSPPYWALRDYKTEGQLGLETTFQEYINKLLAVFDQIKRILKKEGTCWVVLGDTYANNGGKSSPHGTRGDSTHNRNQNYSKAAIIDRPPSGIQEKTLLMIPQRFAIGMIDKGWILRNDIIWHKPNCMPSSATDRFIVDYEHVFFFVKSQRYYFKTQYEPYTPNPEKWWLAPRNQKVTEGTKMKDNPYGMTNFANRKGKKTIGEAYNPEGRIKRTVWKIPTQPYPDAHFAVFPEELIRTPIIAGCPEQICLKCDQPKVITSNKIGEKQRRWSTKNKEGSPYNSQSSMQNIYDYELSDCGCNAGFKAGIVLDPFSGSGTTLLAAHKLLRNWVGIEINKDYVALAKKRLTPYVQQQRLEQFTMESIH